MLPLSWADVSLFDAADTSPVDFREVTVNNPSRSCVSSSTLSDDRATSRSSWLGVKGCEWDRHCEAHDRNRSVMSVRLSLLEGADMMMVMIVCTLSLEIELRRRAANTLACDAAVDFQWSALSIMRTS